jgi:hypothetical protein
MIKAALKLALLAVVANATWHMFTVYSAHYKFKDAVHYVAQYRGDKTDEQLRQQILEMAAQADLPIDAERLTVRHQETHTIVETAYTRVVEPFPGFKYPWPFTVHVDAYTTTPPTPHNLGTPK